MGLRRALEDKVRDAAVDPSDAAFLSSPNTYSVGNEMRFHLIIAVLFITFSVTTGLHSQDAPLTPLLSKCTPATGAVLVSPEAPRQAIATLCSSELKRLDCQELSYLRNYILYSYGRCMNTNEMYGPTLNRASCRKVEDVRAYNSQVDKTIPDEVWPFIGGIIKIESEKRCLADNLIPY